MLVVKELIPIASYTQEKNILLSDWYHATSSSITAGLLLPGTKFTFPGTGQAALINGKGGCAYSGIQIPSCPPSKLSSISITKGEIYRLRIVNVATLAYFNFAVAGHELTIIGVDGTAVKPLTVRSLDITSGQRIDVLLYTQNVPISNYTIGIITNWRGNDTTVSGGTIATMHYTGATSISAIIPPNESKNKYDQQQKYAALIPDILPSSTRTIIFQQAQQYVDGNTFYALDHNGMNTNTSGYLKWTLNGHAYKTSNIAPLLQASSVQQLNSDNFLSASLPIPIALGEVVDIIIQNRVANNGGCEQHPWHLHGIDFWLLAEGDGEFNMTTDIHKYNLQNPPSVDSFILYPSSNNKQRGHNYIPGIKYTPCGWVAIRIHFDQVGMWLFHCHILLHTAMGMEVVFDVDSASLWKHSQLPTDYGTCGLAGYPTTSPTGIPSEIPSLKPTMIPTLKPTSTLVKKPVKKTSEETR